MNAMYESPHSAGNCWRNYAYERERKNKDDDGELLKKEVTQMTI